MYFELSALSLQPRTQNPEPGTPRLHLLKEVGISSGNRKHFGQFLNSDGQMAAEGAIDAVDKIDVYDRAPVDAPEMVRVQLGGQLPDAFFNQRLACARFNHRVFIFSLKIANLIN